MDVIHSIMVFGVAVVAIAILTYATGSVMLGIPTFGPFNPGAATALDFQKQQWNNSMINVTSNSVAALTLTSISPLVLGAALIIGILLSVFVYTQVR